MTVGDLKDILEEFEDDVVVRIGMYQTYGSNFAMSVLEIEEHIVNDWDLGKHKAVVLTEGRQIGTVIYEDE